jgi:hypothetical protein
LKFLTQKIGKGDQEEDNDDGGIVFRIQALEYDADVYSTDGLERKERNKKTGITPKAANEVILQQDAAATAFDLNSLIAALGPSAVLGLLNQSGGGNAGFPYISTFQIDSSVSEVQSVYNAYAGTPTAALQNFTGDTNLSIFFEAEFNSPINTFIVTMLTPSSSFSYWTRINGVDVQRNNFFAYAPSYIEVTLDGVEVGAFTSDWQSNTITIPLRDVNPGVLGVRIQPLLTYDMDQEGGYQIFPFNHQIQPNPSGAGISLIGIAYLL